MSQNCPYCEATKKIKKNGTYTVSSAYADLTVSRFFCRNCGRSFSEHTSIYKPPRKSHTISQEFLKKKSNYKNEKEKYLGSQITDYITSYGLPTIEEITEELRISSKTYYKFLRKLKYDLQSSYIEERKQLDLNEMLFLEIKKEHQTTKAKIRFILLIDLTSKTIFNYFFYEKKKIRSPWRTDIKTNLDKGNEILGYEGKENLKLGYSYNTAHIQQFIANLKKKNPRLSIQLSCSKYLKDKLLKSNPDLFKNSKSNIVKSFTSNIEDYGINRVLNFTYTLELKKYLKYASVPKSIYKAKIEETLNMLISIYNKHQMSLFLKKTARIQQEQHRRRSNQKKGHVFRTNTTKKTNQTKS